MKQAKGLESTARQITHELATPIVELHGYLERALEEAPNHGRTRIMIEAAFNATIRAAVILNASRELFALGNKWHHFLSKGTGLAESERLTQGRVLSLNTLVEMALMAVKEANKKKVFSKVHYSGNCCLECVPSEIIQVVINLFRNAYDACEAEVGVVQITTRNIRTTHEDQKSDGQSDHVELTVQDNGHGIPIEALPRIFEDGFSTRTGIGRGHGLAVASTLVQRNRGTMRFESAFDPESDLDKGTRVTVRFLRMRCGPK